MENRDRWKVSYDDPTYLKEYNKRYSLKVENMTTRAERINRNAKETSTYCPSVEYYNEFCRKEKEKNLKKKERKSNNE